MSHFLLPVMGHLRESVDSVFRYVPCSVCHASIRRQIDNLLLEAEDDIGLFSTTMDGDIVIEDHLAKEISQLEPSVILRPATICGALGEWFQMIPSTCVELSQDSLRTPREHCEACGGVARVQFASYPPLRIATLRSHTPHVAHICGAPLMTVVSGEVLDILSEFDSGFCPNEVLFAED